MRRVTPTVLHSERDGSFDKQVIYITFRKPYVDQKGLIEVTNHFAKGLYKKNVIPDEFVQINANKVGIVVTSITDMMEIKEFGKTRKSVLFIKSGEERIIGPHVTKQEKDDFYATIKGEKKSAREKQVKEDL